MRRHKSVRSVTVSDKILDKLASVMRAQNVSVLQLSKETLISRSTLHRWLRKEVSPDLDRFMEVAAFLGYEVRMVTPERRAKNALTACASGGKSNMPITAHRIGEAKK